MRIRVSEPTTLPDLMAYLSQGEWVSQRVGDDLIETEPPTSLGCSARAELRFSLAAWQTGHPLVHVRIDGAGLR